MKTTMMLADFAQVVGGKLYIMGGGWSIRMPQPIPSALAIKIEVPWGEANKKHTMKVELVDEDFRPVMIPTPEGDKPLSVISEFEVGRPPGLPQGTPIDFSMAFNIPPIPLPPGQRFLWKLKIDDNSAFDDQVAFSTRPAPTPNPVS